MSNQRPTQDHSMQRHLTPDRFLQGAGSRSQPGLASRHPRIVVLGGGTGLPIVFRGLKAASFRPGCIGVPKRDRECLTAFVTAADNGGISGRLRREYSVPPLLERMKA